MPRFLSATVRTFIAALGFVVLLQSPANANFQYDFSYTVSEPSVVGQYYGFSFIGPETPTFTNVATRIPIAFISSYQDPASVTKLYSVKFALANGVGCTDCILNIESFFRNPDLSTSNASNFIFPGLALTTPGTYTSDGSNNCGGLCFHSLQVSMTDLPATSYEACASASSCFIPGQVPEPESYAMLLAGLLLLGFVARQKRADTNTARGRIETALLPQAGGPS